MSVLIGCNYATDINISLKAKPSRDFFVNKAKIKSIEICFTNSATKESINYSSNNCYDVDFLCSASPSSHTIDFKLRILHTNKELLDGCHNMEIEEIELKLDMSCFNILKLKQIVIIF